MVFKFLTRIEKNKKVQMALAVLVGVLVSGFFIYTRITVSHLKAKLAGIYRNECCSDIIIKDGYISQGNRALNLELVTMKGGLSGAIDGRFAREGIQKSEEPAQIIVLNDEGQRALSVSIDGRDYIFRLAR
jgi:hypothetical protein